MNGSWLLLPTHLRDGDVAVLMFTTSNDIYSES